MSKNKNTQILSLDSQFILGFKNILNYTIINDIRKS